MRFPLRLSHLRHMDMPYGTLPDPVQVVFSGIAPGQVIAATAFLPDTMTVGSGRDPPALIVGCIVLRHIFTASM